MTSIYLLGFPRSGTSITRLMITALTGYRPHQPNHQTEQALSDLIQSLGINLNSKAFCKFHYPGHENINILNNENNILIHLTRDPLENLLTLMFTFTQPRHHNYTEEKIANVISTYLIPNVNPGLILQMSKYKANTAFAQTWSGKKINIVHEELLLNPQYLINKLGKIFDLEKARIQFFIDNFERIQNESFKVKSKDILGCNTSGKDFKYWHNKLSEEAIEKFRIAFNA
jgi:hypothetical protein